MSGYIASVGSDVVGACYGDPWRYLERVRAVWGRRVIVRPATSSAVRAVRAARAARVAWDAEAWTWTVRRAT